MEVIVVNNPEEGAKKALDLYRDILNNNPSANFGLATGSTPLGLYNEMKNSDLDFSNASSFNLDEYVGLSFDHPQSYHAFMEQNLFQYKNFKESYVPDGMAKDLEKAASDYNSLLAQNPIELQLLGLGINGHIGFNEPGTSFESKTHIVDLTESTINANARFFDSIDDVPKKAISMGIESIMKAKKVLLLAFGQNKSDAVKAMVDGELTENVPASILQNHPDATIIVDKEAASLLK